VQVTCKVDPWSLLLTLFVNAAAAKLVMKKTRAMTTSRKSTSRDLLLVALMPEWLEKVIVILFCHS
jgi:hypothetical protein